LAELQALDTKAFPILAKRREELEAKVAGEGGSLGSLRWGDLLSRLADCQSVSQWIPKQSSRLPRAQRTRERIAARLLAREFLRRPRRQYSLETLGLARLHFPTLDGATPPVVWQQQGLDAKEWGSFLHTAVDIVCRQNAALILA